jgi:hypothetical protein
VRPRVNRGLGVDSSWLRSSSKLLCAAGRLLAWGATPRDAAPRRCGAPLRAPPRRGATRLRVGRRRAPPCLGPPPPPSWVAGKQQGRAANAPAQTFVAACGGASRGASRRPRARARVRGGPCVAPTCAPPAPIERLVSASPSRARVARMRSSAAGCVALGGRARRHPGTAAAGPKGAQRPRNVHKLNSPPFWIRHVRPTAPISPLRPSPKRSRPVQVGPARVPPPPRACFWGRRKSRGPASWRATARIVRGGVPFSPNLPGRAPGPGASPQASRYPYCGPSER